MGSVIRDKRSGNVVWAIRYQDVDGRVRKERTKAPTMAVARRILAERERQVEQAKLRELASVDALARPKPAVTIRKYAEEYLAHQKAHLRPGTVSRDLDLAKNHVLPKLGSFTLRQVNPGILQKYSDDRLREGAAPATVRKELYWLSGMYRMALKAEVVERNPVALVDKPSTENIVVRWLDQDEEAKLLAVAPQTLAQAIVVAIHSGLREEEQRSLFWADVRFDDNLLIVRHSKNRSFRAVPMSRTLAATLDAIPRVVGSPYVFTNPKTRERYDRFNNTPWRKAVLRSGIAPIRWHDLRHTFGSRLAQQGVSIITIKELMGHKSIQVTMRYAHLAPSNMHEAVKVLDRKPLSRHRMDPKANP